MAELCRVTGVSLPTVKYYLREGLLPPGERTQVNQAEYDQRHVRRLRLIRAMVDIGRMPVESVRQVLTAVDDAEPLPDVLRAASHALTRPSPAADTDSWRATRERIQTYLHELGWYAESDSPAVDELTDVLLSWNRALEVDRDPAEAFGRYVAAVEPLSEWEVDVIAGQEKEEVVYDAVVGMVLGDRALTALRRLAQRNYTHRNHSRHALNTAGTANSDSPNAVLIGPDGDKSQGPD